jgi:hypothetical protein
MPLSGAQIKFASLWARNSALYFIQSQTPAGVVWQPEDTRLDEELQSGTVTGRIHILDTTPVIRNGGTYQATDFMLQITLLAPASPSGGVDWNAPRQVASELTALIDGKEAAVYEYNMTTGAIDLTKRIGGLTFAVMGETSLPQDEGSARFVNAVALTVEVYSGT